MRKFKYSPLQSDSLSFQLPNGTLMILCTLGASFNWLKLDTSVKFIFAMLAGKKADKV